MFVGLLGFVGELISEFVDLSLVGRFGGRNFGQQLLDFEGKVIILGLEGVVFLHEDFYFVESLLILSSDVLAHQCLFSELVEFGLNRICDTVCFFRKSRNLRFSVS